MFARSLPQPFHIGCEVRLGSDELSSTARRRRPRDRPQPRRVRRVVAPAAIAAPAHLSHLSHLSHRSHPSHLRCTPHRLFVRRREWLALGGHHAARIERRDDLCDGAGAQLLAPRRPRCVGRVVTRGAPFLVDAGAIGGLSGLSLAKARPSAVPPGPSAAPMAALSTIAESVSAEPSNPSEPSPGHHLVRFPVKVPLPMPPRSSLPFIAVLLSISPS